MTPKQALFVQEYLVDLNATQAARRAGYSERTAGTIGFENLQKPEIAEAISRAMSARSMRTQVTADRVLEEYARIAFARLSDVVEWGTHGVTIKPSAELSDNVLAAVERVECNQSEYMEESGGGILRTQYKVKLHGKQAALDALAKHLGITPETVRLKVDDLNSMTDDELRALAES